MGAVNRAQDPLVCTVYTKKSTITAQKQKKKKANADHKC